MKKAMAMILAVMMLVSVLCASTTAMTVSAQEPLTFVVDTVSTTAGQTVSVAVRTQNNPGIVSLRLAVGYDAAVLTPTGMEAQDFPGATFGPLDANPLSVMWVDAIHPDVTTNGVVAMLTFQVAADAPEGTYPLTVTAPDEKDIFNFAFENLDFNVVDGSVSVVTYTPGDVNGDSSISVFDLGFLQRYLNGWDVELCLPACDVNGDDSISMFDLGILQRYLNGWDVELLPAGPTIGGTPSTPDEPDEPVIPDEPDVPSEDTLTIPEAIELGLAQGENSYTETKYYVTGEIIAVSNSTYGNMYIVDEAGNQLFIYGTYSADGELRYDALEYAPVAGDTVTVYGVIGTYNGNEAQMKNGWITDIVKGDGVENSDPAADSTLTIEEAIALGASKLHNVYTEGKYYVTGVISEVYNDQYGNMYLMDDAGNTLTVYGSYSADGTVRYDSLDVKPVAGDTVTLYGIIGQYNGIPQMKNGWIMAINGGDAPVEPDEPVTPDEPIVGDAVIDFTDIANRLSYSTEQQVWAQNGITVTNNKGASTSNVGDYGGEGYPARFYKSSELIVEYPGMTSIVFDCDDYKDYATSLADSITNGTATVEGNLVTVVLDKAVDTFIISELAAQVRVNNITVCGNGAGGDAPVEPDEPVIPDEPDVPAEDTLTIPEAIELGLAQGENSYTEDKYYVTGEIIAVSNSTYGNMYIVDEAGNQLLIYGTYSADGELRYDALEYAPVAGDTVTVYGVIGTYNGNEAQMKNGWITDIVKGDGVENNDPAADSVLTIEEAIALGASKLHNVYTEDKYYVTGLISEVYNDQYGNMYLMDDAGNTLTVYGSYSADGTVRYDSLDVKPVAGDTVTLYGIIGQYNGTPQMKNGWIMAINGGDAPVEPDEPVTPDEPDVPSEALSVVDAPVAGEAYKFGMVQGNVSASDVYYLTGEMNGYYMDTTTDASAAIDVYLEETEGGYYLYTMNEKGTVYYINMVVSGTHVNGQLGAATATTVYTFDTENYTLIAYVDGVPYWFGTRNDKTYTTVGPCKTEYNGFYCQFYA